MAKMWCFCLWNIILLMIANGLGDFTWMLNQIFPNRVITMTVKSISASMQDACFYIIRYPSAIMLSGSKLWLSFTSTRLKVLKCLKGIQVQSYYVVDYNQKNIFWKCSGQVRTSHFSLLNFFIPRALKSLTGPNEITLTNCIGEAFSIGLLPSQV